MAIIQWDPFRDIERVFDAEWPFMSISKSSPLMAPLDIYEKGNDIIAEVQMPGINQKDVEITVEGNLLRISATREDKKEVEEKEYVNKEIRRGSLERIARLPSLVDSGTAHAKIKDGMLTITLPKQKNVESNAVKIKVE